MDPNGRYYVIPDFPKCDICELAAFGSTEPVIRLRRLLDR
jgi:hypothetical protein